MNQPQHPTIINTAPLDESHVQFAYQLAAELEANWPRIYQHGPLNPHAFADALWHGSLAHFLITVQGRPAGIAGLYDADFRNGIAWIEVVLVPVLPLLDASRESVLAALEELAFERFGLRKLFCVHLGCAEPPLGVSGTEEARLKDSVLHDGWYWDRVITSLEAAATGASFAKGGVA